MIPTVTTDFMVQEDVAQLCILDGSQGQTCITHVLEALRQDLVALIQHLTPEQADNLVEGVAKRLGLADELAIQAGYAGLFGHRHNIGKYFMSVNKRQDYQFISPHSEGTSFVANQLASFYCFENTTDGGETILMKVDDSSPAWQYLRERVMRGKLDNKQLSQNEIQRAKALYQINLPADVLRSDDRVLREHDSQIPGLTILEVLAVPQKTHSRILGREVYAYWDTIEGFDLASASEYQRLLKQSGLLKEPEEGLKLCQFDESASRRVWNSGLRYAELFQSRITHKLAPRELVLMNNLTWTHAAANWTPGSGTRKIAASFA